MKTVIAAVVFIIVGYFLLLGASRVGEFVANLSIAYQVVSMIVLFGLLATVMVKVGLR